jgi:hypothetical protein
MLDIRYVQAMEWTVEKCQMIRYPFASQGLSRKNWRACARHPTTILLALALVLSGCASHLWAPGPGQSLADFEPAKARCSLLARHGGSGFVAFGSQSYVAGATLGHAIGESIRANQDFNDCMVATGWRIADGQTAATQSVAVARLKGMRDQRAACIAEVRSRPDYASAQAHFNDLGTGAFTMAQLTDDRTPTLAESRLIVSYIDEITPCIVKFIESATHVSPAIGPILLQVKSSGDGIMVLLAQRKLTWGDASQRLKQVGDEGNAKLREIRL